MNDWYVCIKHTTSYNPSTTTLMITVLYYRYKVILTLTLIHPVSNWTHWATLRRHPYLSRAATSASSQVNPIFCRSLLTVLLQFALGRPGPLLYPGTCQYSACCGMRWWSIVTENMSKPAKSSFSQYVVHDLLSSSGSDLFVCYPVFPRDAQYAPLLSVMPSTVSVKQNSKSNLSSQ